MNGIPTSNAIKTTNASDNAEKTSLSLKMANSPHNNVNLNVHSDSIPVHMRKNVLSDRMSDIPMASANVHNNLRANDALSDHHSLGLINDGRSVASTFRLNQ